LTAFELDREDDDQALDTRWYSVPYFQRNTKSIQMLTLDHER
jgi:hypothetical protein